MDNNLSFAGSSGRGQGNEPGGGDPKDLMHLYGGGESGPDRPENDSEEDIPDSGVINIEAALNQVKEQVTSFADSALKSLAEALAGIGISPTILGYGEEDFMFDDEAEASQRRVQRDQVLQKSSYARRSEGDLSRRRAEEEGTSGNDEEDASGNAPAAFEDKQSGSWQNLSGGEEPFYEDKKDK
eukprot:TRINITY_DN22910_c0_g1_i1.p1 TRINITY_DN22910_c0_g1~~TRINITY_DN22910_c0_g1_i1.p1  ORF type:complete len:184 (-),score=58.88 TRINITY_DN22910_c0_g1_i1:858-1409(-)